MAKQLHRWENNQPEDKRQAAAEERSVVVMKNPSSVLFASYSERTQSHAGSIRRHRGRILKRALLSFLNFCFYAKGVLLSPSENSCTSSGTSVVPELFWKWATKDHLNFFPISTQFWGCERVLHSHHCELDLKALSHVQGLLWALQWTLRWLEVTSLSKHVLQECSMLE